jgi:two-component system, OmpR family, response regulator ResD
MSETQKTIIYIDDDYQAGLLSKVFLERAGFRVEICQNTQDARKALEKGNIDMLITDIGLPGENGIQFYEWLMQSKYKDMPVLMVSAHAMGFSHVLTEHRDIFFEKPIFFPIFIEKIKEILSNKSSKDK